MYYLRNNETMFKYMYMQHSVVHQPHPYGILFFYDPGWQGDAKAHSLWPIGIAVFLQVLFRLFICEPGRGEGKEARREGGRERGRESGREGGREGEREGEGGREKGRERGREKGREREGKERGSFKKIVPTKSSGFTKSHVTAHLFNYTTAYNTVMALAVVARLCQYAVSTSTSLITFPGPPPRFRTASSKSRGAGLTTRPHHHYCTCIKMHNLKCTRFLTPRKPWRSS